VFDGENTPKKCIMIFFDIFGYESGRHKNIVDYFSDQGYFVVMPDYFRGDALIGNAEPPQFNEVLSHVKKFPIESIKKDVEKVYQWCINKGAEKVGSIAFCYGTWISFQVCDERFCCGVNFHPSNVLEKMLGGDDEGLTNLVKCNMLIMPTKQDDDYYRDGGSV